MPARKKIKRKRPTYLRCGQMVLTDAQKALSIARSVKSLLNVEYKQKSNAAQSLAITDTASAVQLVALSQGDTAITRDGSQVKFTSLRFSYFIKIHASALNTMVRVMIVHDKQTNQAQATATDVLQDSTPVDAIVSPYNIDNVSRFRILYDKVHGLSSVGSTSCVQRTIHKKLNLKVRYDGNAGNVTDLTQDSIFLILVSDEATNDPTISHQLRLRYLDN